MSRLEPLPEQQLFGIETAQAKLNDVIQGAGRPWLIAINGIGGIGKTTLANTLVRTMLDQAAFFDIGWVSAKQEEFPASQGIQSTGRAALDIDTLTDALLDQLQDQPLLAASAEQKRAALIARVKAQPYLIVVDNLETVIDYEALLPYLRALAGPSKFLLTSRLSLKAQADVFCLSLTELSQPDALAFLRHEADMRGIEPLTKASSEQLETIYSVVGGNPRP